MSADKSSCGQQDVAGVQKTSGRCTDDDGGGYATSQAGCSEMASSCPCCPSRGDLTFIPGTRKKSGESSLTMLSVIVEKRTVMGVQCKYSNYTTDRKSISTVVPEDEENKIFILPHLFKYIAI